MFPTKHLTFQAKVLIPIVTLMILLFSLTIWLVNQRLTAQLQEDARQTLTAVETVFRNSMDIRARNLLLRWENVVNEPRFKAVAQLAEAKTMTVQLRELRGEIGAETIAYTTLDGLLLAGAPQSTWRELGSNSSATIEQALSGRSNSETVVLQDSILQVASLPVRVGDAIVGVLTIATRMDEIAAREIRSLSHSEIAFFANDRLLVSTFHDRALDSNLGTLFHDLTHRSSGTHPLPQLITPQEEHFVCLAGELPGRKQPQIGYLLLSPFDVALQQMASTQRVLWGLSLAGIVFSSLFIAALIREMMRPLRQLRESAEAIGRGDFSRRVDVQSKDEFGELAVAFNQMRENLTASRAETETAIKSLQDTQAQLIQTEKLSAIGEFVAGVAHELNNPLTAVVGFSEMLQDSEINSRQQTFAKRIAEGAERCHRIVQNLLSFARQHPSERKWIGINKLIEAVIEIVSYELRTSNIEVVTDFTSDLPRLLLDPHQMQQVFLNIMNNARQAIEEHQSAGMIRISTKLVQGSVRVAFEDSGPGIPAENVVRIFDPFFTTKPVGIGTGLGLSLSYGIVREHGGTITVQNRDGKGAVFTVHLPVPKRDAESIAEKQPIGAAPESLPQGSGKTVLVIDDEDAILELLKEALSRHGYEVDTAREGDSAIRQFQQHNYDLVVCDWKIPGLGGQQIFERVCELRPRAAECFIFMTGDSLNPKAQQFLWTHNRPCLLKPFSMEELQSTIRKVLSSN